MLVLHYRQLASLGSQAAQEQWGVDAFDEKHRDTHSFAKRVGRLPEQQENDDVDYRGLLHRDGSVVSAVTLQVGCLRLPSSPPWAAWYNTWLLMKLAQKGVVFSFLPFHKNSAVQKFKTLGGLPMSLTSASSKNSWNRPMAFDPPPTHASRMSGLPTYKSDISIINKLMEQTDGI